MQIVIDIPESLYKQFTVDHEYYEEDGESLMVAVKRGVLLPDHGRLIDANEVLGEMAEEQQELKQELSHESGRIWEASILMQMVADAPTVIDLEGEDDED